MCCFHEFFVKESGVSFLPGPGITSLKLCTPTKQVYNKLFPTVFDSSTYTRIVRTVAVKLRKTAENTQFLRRPNILVWIWVTEMDNFPTKAQQLGAPKVRGGGDARARAHTRTRRSLKAATKKEGRWFGGKK